MAKRMLDCCASDFAQFTKADLLESIQKSEGRVIACETIGSVQPLLGNVTNAEFAASMGADILLLNLFDVQQPVIHGLPPVEPGETIRLLKKLTGRPVGINLEPVADDAEIETDPMWAMSAGRRATVENALRAKKLGIDFVLATPASVSPTQPLSRRSAVSKKPSGTASSWRQARCTRRGSFRRRRKTL